MKLVVFYDLHTQDNFQPISIRPMISFIYESNMLFFWRTESA